MRRFIFASHHKLAYGLKDTVDFLTGATKTIYDINAYLDDETKDIDTVVAELFAFFDDEDEVVVLVDMMGGSVYQKFYPYMSDKVHVICGMNLPMALSLVLAPEDECLTSEKVEQVLMDCKNQLVYVNKMAASVDEDDE
ncbi:PTS sugar transporter subunit IIA [Holdemanella hominis]|uniref:PTS sorbitol transporter subunit IIB n=1 Tax=Holdemanella hominis TaxID=2764327 RepID=A0ABR7KFM7_9FIRM|nr:PTS sorbitol transporter subunit IIB [Holdemanella hominis]MBC6011458.1 PTS sorbitol transporter subunit IIB [Holdemanella hominis]